MLIPSQLRKKNISLPLWIEILNDMCVEVCPRVVLRPFLLKTEINNLDCVEMMRNLVGFYNIWGFYCKTQLLARAEGLVLPLLRGHRYGCQVRVCVQVLDLTDFNIKDTRMLQYLYSLVCSYILLDKWCLEGA